ncbi:hypothetical protein F6X51_17935 [Methylobacterium planeticum]|uniref:Uncharacterized protein n=1 Tax=Methylobacterium planeticum TaxID=2615211 RepID=A0A6N6MPB5_9HYPH|nr:hypothetical protein F6X51_17935 [Methylobacterium planeticum]
MILVPPALAQDTPRSVNDCERLKNDLAYNQCLSMFGPAAKNIAGGDGGAGPAPVSTAAAAIPVAEDPAPEVGRSRRGRYRARRGRQSAVFTAGSDESRSYRRRRRR